MNVLGKIGKQIVLYFVKDVLYLLIMWVIIIIVKFVGFGNVFVIVGRMIKRILCFDVLSIMRIRRFRF